jgi:hypothetical protein
MDKDTTNSTFTEYLNGLDFANFSQEVKRLQLDHYTKKLFTTHWLKLMIYAQSLQITSLTDLSLHLRENPALQQEVGLDSISTSQLSRKLRAVSPDVLQAMFTQLATSVFTVYRLSGLIEQKKRLCIVDASTITMCLTTYPWATFRSTKAGIKLHQRVDFVDGTTIPDKAILTPARPSDKSQMNALVEIASDATYVFDRGYIDYRTFDEYCESGVRFTTRMKHNACIREVEEERPVDPTSMVKRDAIIWLGQYPGYWMRSKLRLVEVQGEDGKIISIFTNDFERSAKEIGDLYRNRWQVELFFKWIKQHLVVKRFYGTGQWAVFSQLWIVLITYLLLVKIRERVAQETSSLLARYTNKSNSTGLSSSRCLCKAYVEKGNEPPEGDKRT